MKAVLTMMILMMVACGEVKEQIAEFSDSEVAPVDHEFSDIDPIFQPMVDLLGCQIPEDLTAGFVDELDDYVAGRCYVYEDGSHEMKVDRNEWALLSTEQREILVLHELGHCV